MGAGAGMAGAQMVHESLGQLGGMIASHRAQEDAQDFAKHMYRHRYRYSMDDARKAGLNPILAMTGNQPGTPPTSAAMARHGQPSSSSAASALQAYSQAKLNKEKAVTEKTLQGANSAQAANLEATTLRTQQETLIKGQEVPGSDMRKQVMEFIQDGFNKFQESAAGSAKEFQNQYKEDLERVRTWLERNPNALPYNPKGAPQ